MDARNSEWCVAPSKGINVLRLQGTSGIPSSSTLIDKTCFRSLKTHQVAIDVPGAGHLRTCKCDLPPHRNPVQDRSGNLNNRGYYFTGLKNHGITGQCWCLREIVSAALYGEQPIFGSKLSSFVEVRSCAVTLCAVDSHLICTVRLINDFKLTEAIEDWYKALNAFLLPYFCPTIFPSLYR